MQHEIKKEQQKHLESLDKRTKEYKEYKKRNEQQSKGLGDTIAKATKATGIDKVVKFIAGEDCGCDERQEFLNKEFAYDVPKCLTEEEFNYLTRLIESKPAIASIDMQKRIIKIHNRIFTNQIQVSSCPSCVRKTIQKLEKILKQY
jgi:hypothetical protein